MTWWSHIDEGDSKSVRGIHGRRILILGYSNSSLIGYAVMNE